MTTSLFRSKPWPAALTALTLVVSVNASPASDTSSVKKRGKEACETRWDKKNANDPCNQAYVFEKAATAQGWSARIYAAASAVCLTECIWNTGGTACQLSGYGATIGEMGLSLQVGAAGNNVLGQLGAPLMMLGQQIGGDKATSRKQSCIAAAVNGAQSTVRWINYEQTKKSINDAYQAKLDMLSDAEKLELEDTSSRNPTERLAPSQGGATQSIGGVIKNDSSGFSDAVKEKSFEENAIEAGQTPILRAFEQVTGKPAGQLDDRVAAGMPPLLAAADMAAGSLGPAGLQAMNDLAVQSSAASAELRAQLDALDGKTGVTTALYENSSSSGGRGGSSGQDSGLPDLQALMEQIMPSKNGEEKSRGPSPYANFASRQPAALPAQDLHPPVRSIFDVVGNRYQLMSSKLLSDGNVLTKPLSALPANIYLKK